jgi:hypothetical protein
LTHGIKRDRKQTAHQKCAGYSGDDSFNRMRQTAGAVLPGHLYPQRPIARVACDAGRDGFFGFRQQLVLVAGSKPKLRHSNKLDPAKAHDGNPVLIVVSCSVVHPASSCDGTFGQKQEQLFPWTLKLLLALNGVH